MVAINRLAGRRKKDGTKESGADKKSNSNRPRKGIQKAAFETTKKKTVGVSDLTLISKVNNEEINNNLHKRFENGEIYTYIGHVLVSVNPFKDLGIYTDQVLDTYKGKNRIEMPPHVFAIAESSYYNMKAYSENQCIIISGESGAGKTEAAKRIIQYIANVSGGSDSSIQQIKNMVLATNPLLESFGNAKTLRNNNSSRFGKYLEIQFNAQGEPMGANINNYLLEKSRVVGQTLNERNFHIFYQFTKFASPQYREAYGIQGPESYVYTSRSKCFDVEGIDDSSEYRDTLNAMNIIGMAQNQQDNVFRMLSTVLWLGNVTFSENDHGNAVVADQSVTQFVAYLLQVPEPLLVKALTQRTMETGRGGRRGSTYEVPLNPAQAASVRDALSKAIYFNMFDWIVLRVNESLRANGTPAFSVGILDIYGFEIFEHNSFEQLCINYVNEKLQQIFIQLTLKTEQEEYARENIKWTPIKYFDNKVVCDLIEGIRPAGVIATLNDACASAHADPSGADRAFLQRCNMLASNSHFLPRQDRFVIKHYAGDVEYDTKGLTDKNKDQLLKDLLLLLSQSENRFVTQTLFTDVVDESNNRRPPTAGDKIKKSANELVTTLMKASPSYIRTIKPNENKSPTEYNTANVLHQIKYLGLQENVRIRRAGFAYRQTFEKFVERFYLLSPAASYAGDYTWTGSYQSGVIQILKDSNIPVDQYQIGTSKCFIKDPETLFALESMRDKYWHNMAIRIQRAWRNYMRYRAECATRIQRFWRRINGSLAYNHIRQEGHQILGGRKERRRYSLLGYRRFMGDYLGISNSGGPGEFIRTSISLTESVLFSCRGQQLVSKLARSSKLEPRTLILTPKNVIIVKQVLVNGQVSIQIDRQIPLGAIKFISSSNLHDDFFSMGIGSAQEADPLLVCVFKTEFFTHLKRASRGAVDIRVGPTVEYSKKPGKIVTVKVVKDANPGREDIYKTSTIHTGAGMPPNSVSKRAPRPNPGISKPITKGKLLRPGGPKGGPSKIPASTSRNTTVAALPGVSSRPAQGNAYVAQQQQQQPVQKQAFYSEGSTAPVASTTASNNSRRIPPPPPPPPVSAPSRDARYRMLYDFSGQTGGELSLIKGDIVEVTQKEPTGWWLAQLLDNPEVTGWVPTAYLEEVPMPVESRAALPLPPPPPPPMASIVNMSSNSRSKPAPPAKRPKPSLAGTGGRDSGYSAEATASNSVAGSSSNLAASSGPAGLLGGMDGLAIALQKRQAAMAARKQNDSDDDW